MTDFSNRGLKKLKHGDIVLSDGRKVTIYEPRSWMYWRAEAEFITMEAKEDQCNMLFVSYMLRQMIEIDGDMVSVEDIGNMECSDYDQLIQVFNFLSSKVKL